MSAKTKEEERKHLLEVIEVYRSLPSLWDVKRKAYSNKYKRTEDYKQLLCKYKEKYPTADKQEFIKKNSLRTNFRKELKRLNECARSGAGTEEPIEPTSWYYDEFQFLIPQEEPTTSENTIEIVEQRDKEGEEELGDGSSSVNTTCCEAEPRKKKSKRNDNAQEQISLAPKRHKKTANRI
ncbi:uncharacterized protein LOC143373795 [Andrena cerasifolii]|uniref:uncharacterized protein LOC143373795 n=1 Tax=Andrena cerasifolii TaxID=2819439 RepID=UPI004037BCF3